LEDRRLRLWALTDVAVRSFFMGMKVKPLALYCRRLCCLLAAQLLPGSMQTNVIPGVDL